MHDNNTKDNNNQRNLSNAFEELKKARNNSIQAKKETPKEVNETKQVKIQIIRLQNLKKENLLNLQKARKRKE